MEDINEEKTHINKDNDDELSHRKTKEKSKSKRKWVIFSILLTVIVVVIGVWFLFIPHLHLLGNKKVTIRLGEKFEEAGYKATVGVKNITEKVVVQGQVNSQKVGKYFINYKVKYHNITIIKKRIVLVIDDIKPEISLQGASEIKLCPSKTYDDEGYTAFDNYDGDITNKVKVVAQEDKIIYKVSDSSGNEATVIRKVIREDQEKPIISLKGSKTVYLNIGANYNEPGFTATDNCVGDMTSKVTVIGSIDSSKSGNQELSYKVVDEKGNEAIVTRNVFVKYPSGYVPPTVYKDNMIYLTFDDGPSNVTPQILDILKQKNVKATFFVIGASSDLDYLIKREKEEGHTVALHSYTHRYDLVYSSFDNYFDDLNKISQKVANIIGEETKIIRFPGGGSNLVSKKYTLGIMSTLTNEVLMRGYHYFDWNIDCDDAGSAKNRDDVYYNVVNNLHHNQTNVVLMHDFQNNYKTLEALSDIIDYGKANGYTFAAIDMDTPLVRHRVFN